MDWPTSRAHLVRALVAQVSQGRGTEGGGCAWVGLCVGWAVRGLGESSSWHTKHTTWAMWMPANQAHRLPLMPASVRSKLQCSALVESSMSLH